MDDLSRTVDELSVEEGETDATLEDYNMPLLEAECDAQLKGVITESARRTLRAGLQQGLSMEQTRSCVIRALETFIECANSTTNQVDDLRYETDFLEHISTSGDNKVEQDFLTFVSGVFKIATQTKGALQTSLPTYRPILEHLATVYREMAKPDLEKLAALENDGVVPGPGLIALLKENGVELCDPEVRDEDTD